MPDAPDLQQCLLALAQSLDAAAEQIGWGTRPQLVRGSPAPDDPASIDLGLCPTDIEGGVIEALAGFRAPPEWEILGVLTEGNAFHTDPAGQRKLGCAGRARVVHLVHRSGVSASVMRQQGNDEAASTACAPAGRVDDFCRRGLGIDTTPPQTTTLELWALHWLDAIITELPRTWRDTVSLHPGAATLLSASAMPHGVDLERHLLQVGRAFAKFTSWERLRAECISGHAGTDVVSPEMAAWFDTGSFSRAVLEGWLPLDALAGSAVDAVPSDIGEKIDDTLDGWDLW